MNAGVAAISAVMTRFNAIVTSTEDNGISRHPPMVQVSS
jgi:hypothetical protein